MKNIQRKRLFIFLGLGVVFASGTVGMAVYSTRNYAREAGSAIERGIIAADGVKKCSKGDNGHNGTDNTRPWYEAYYEMPASKEGAVLAIKRAVEAAGFHPNPATPSQKGQLSFIDDAYIRDWFFDNSSKQNSHTDLKSGPVELAFGVNASGAKDACRKGGSLKIDATHSVINLTLRLPAFRK